MNASGLPARIGYTVVALPLGGAAGFYASMYMLPRLAARWTQLDAGIDGQGFFNAALGVGAGVGFTLGLIALTMPWSRHRKRRGRPWRIGVASVVVVVASVGFAAEVHGLVYGLTFAVWLAYTMAYTFVRYGVVDDARRRSASSTRY